MAQNSLQVVFLVDITGSMGSQIEGVKQMIAKFCEIDRPFIDVHIWTYTENPGCHVTHSPVGLKSAQLVKYTKDIVLCHPPGVPNVNAGGGDGPENVTAGIAALVNAFDVNQNLLCFIVTDAKPHHISFGLSSEAKEEIKWLEEAGFEDTDVFIVLCQVIDSLNITFVPVLYGDAINGVWFHQAAAMTEGLVLCPKAASSEVLAAGLGVLLDTFQKLSVSRDLTLTKSLNTEDLSKGFRILDINPEEFQMLEEDPKDPSKIVKNYQDVVGTEVVAEKIAAPFKTALDRFSGKKAATRCRDISGEHIAASIRVLLRGVLYASKSALFKREIFDADIAELKTHLELLSEKDSKYTWELKVLNKFTSVLDSFLHRFEPILSSPTPHEDLLLTETLSAKIESLNQKPYSELDVTHWMNLVLELLTVRLINIKFPLNASGKPDFADAWSASIDKIEYESTLKGSVALSSKSESTNLYTSPKSIETFNSALIVAHNTNAFLTEIYLLLSYFPTLQGLIQSHLVSSAYKVFPSITFGLQASLLWYVLRVKINGPEFSDNEWELVRSLALSFKASQLKPAANAYKSCKKSLAFSPVDGFSKIFSGVLAYYKKNSVPAEKSQLLLRLLFEEYSVENILYELKKADSGLPTDEEIVKFAVDLEEIEKFDPLTGIHPIEEIINQGKDLGDEFLVKVRNGVCKSKVLKNTISVFRVACGLLACSLNQSSASEGFGSEEVRAINDLLSDELLADVFFESFILKKRTARYVLHEESKQWKRDSLERIPSTTLSTYCLNLLKDALQPKLSNWNIKRKESCQRKLIETVAGLQGVSFEDFNTQLATLSYSVHNFSLKLTRTDVFECLNTITADLPEYENRLKTLGLALVVGNWTNAPPSQLRKSLKTILEKFSAFNEICEKIKEHFSVANECLRVVEKPNRHGHNLENKYPGVNGWSQEYEDQVKKSKKKGQKKLALHLKELKEYTLFYQEVVRSVLESEEFGKNQKDLVNWCISYNQDARMMNRVKGFVDRIKGLKMENEEGKDWDSLTRDIKVKLAKSKIPWTRLDKFLKSAEPKLAS